MPGERRRFKTQLAGPYSHNFSWSAAEPELDL
jgi:hypothetical protein